MHSYVPAELDFVEFFPRNYSQLVVDVVPKFFKLLANKSHKLLSL
jgi:hypothetical protein